MASGGAEIFGDKALQRTFKELGERVQRRLLRQSVNAAATPVVKRARTNLRKRSGLSKKAMGKKIKTYPDKMTVVAVIGPRTDVQGEYNGKKVVPWRYDHLVEQGHVDEQGHVVAPQPFLKPAMEETRGEALGVLKDKLGAGIEKEAAKA